MTVPPEHLSGVRSWTITNVGINGLQVMLRRGSGPVPGESIEVISVADHERLMQNRCTCVLTCGDRPEDEGGICKLLPRDDGREWTRS